MTRTHPFIYLYLCLILLQAGCASVDFDQERSQSHALALSENSALGKYVSDWQSTQADGISGFYPLNEGMDALGARLRLIDAAEKSIDLQYFLMKGDTAGRLFSARLLEAADRGVRIRFLLDDIFTTIDDIELFVLNQHPNIEIRLFNPIARRGFQKLNFLREFDRANRRMHNKSFTADGSFTIVGGRNIAAEYFNLRDNTEFFDLDVLAIGPIVTEVSDSFDEFWNHSKAVPIENLKQVPGSEAIEQTREKIDQIASIEATDVYRRAINSTLIEKMAAQEIEPYLAQSRLLSDDAVKLDTRPTEESMKLIQELGQLLRQAESEIVLVTPYFIPTKKGVKFWQEITAKDIDVTLLTNSLASTNHVPVHAAYEGYRKDLLRAGFTLYEARPDAYQIMNSKTKSKRISTLHTKLVIIDRRYVFIGSLNLDPRSVVINTEMGVLIDSTDLASRLLENHDLALEKLLYKVVLNDKGKLEWHTEESGNPTVLHKEPQTSIWRRFQASIFKLLPEGQL